jgi:thiosulfate dehydrogenase
VNQRTAPVLKAEDAYDVAGYVNSHKRAEKANLEKDFPVRIQKPIDTPYGPYADDFSLEQHKYGPFGPIRAKVQELAVMARTAKADEPDKGATDADRAR